MVDSSRFGFVTSLGSVGASVAATGWRAGRILNVGTTARSDLRARYGEKVLQCAIVIDRRLSYSSGSQPNFWTAVGTLRRTTDASKPSTLAKVLREKRTGLRTQQRVGLACRSCVTAKHTEVVNVQASSHVKLEQRALPHERCYP